MGLIIGGKSYDVEDQVIQSFQDDKAFGLKPNDGKKRPKTWIRGIVVHTTKGIPGGRNKTPQKIKPGIGPNSERDEKVAKMWSTDDRNAGAHLVVDSDGSWVCTCDLQTFAAYHAGNVNSVTVGIEIYQESDAGIYEVQLKNTIVMVNFLTRHFGIQRQFHKPYKRHAITRGLQKGPRHGRRLRPSRLLEQPRPRRPRRCYLRVARGLRLRGVRLRRERRQRHLEAETESARTVG